MHQENKGDSSLLQIEVICRRARRQEGRIFLFIQAFNYS